MFIRPLRRTLDEYQAIARVHNAVWSSNPKTAGQLKSHDEARNPNFLFQRLLVEVNGHIVGCAVFGENAWSYQPGKYFLDVTVLPSYQKQGLGSALYDHIIDNLSERDPAPRLLTAETREDKPEAVSFLSKRGFRQVMREPSSSIDVADFDREQFAEHVARARREGIAVHSMTELKEMNPDWKRVWYDLEGEINRDHPNADEGARLPFATFAAILDGPHVSTDAYFIAIDKKDSTDRYVGISGLSRNWADPTIFSTEMTGVIRSHRRRGIATALKVNAITFVKEQGGRVIYTGNEENNPMFVLNQRLGFKPGPAWLSFHRNMP